MNILMVLILIFGLRLNADFLKYPIDYNGDMLQVMTYFKLLITGDMPFYSYASSQMIGQPFGFVSADFPSPMAANFLFIKFLGLFSSNVVVVTNVYILISYFMIINSMFFVLRRLRVNHYVAIMISLLFALVPFHHIRIAHTWYVNYFLLPIGIYYLLLLWRSKPLFFVKNPFGKDYKLDLSFKNLIIAFFLIIFSVWNFYYTFFFVILAIAATISAYYYRRSRYTLYSGLLLIFLVTAPFVINLIPYKVYQVEHGKNTQALKRYAHESEVYGLKIAQMLLPVDGHNNYYMARLKARYDLAPLVNENQSATLGLVGAIGFFLMTIFMLFHEKIFSTIKKLSVLGYAAVMVATIGGYSSIFAVIVSPNIRGYNRMSILVSTIAMMVFALAMSRLIQRYSARRILFPLLSVIILAIGIYDQVPRSYMNYKRAINIYKPYYELDTHYMKKLEKELASVKDKKVFQLPYTPTPESKTIYGMGEYQQITAYLWSHDIKWSNGAVKGRESDKWISRLLMQPLEKQVEILRSSGFSGIYIDRRAYVDRGKSLEAKLSKLLKEKPIVNENGSKSFFRLYPTGEKTYKF